MHISLAVSMVRPISHHEHSEHKCLHLKVILVLHLPVRSAIRYQNTKHRMSSLHIFLGYGYGDQIGTGSGWHGDVQAVHPIFCPLQSTSKHAGSTQATFGFMAPYFRALPDQLSWPRNHMRPLSSHRAPINRRVNIHFSSSITQASTQHCCLHGLRVAITSASLNDHRITTEQSSLNIVMNMSWIRITFRFEN